jgi:hypothetical protein
MTQLQLSLNPEEVVDALIDGVLAGLSGPWQLWSNEMQLLRMLREHKGAENPLQLNTIAIQLGMSPRDIKSAVKSLVEDFKLPIGGSRQKPFGYFLIVSGEDLEAALRPLVHELQSIARRVKALTGEQRMAEIFNQARLALESEKRDA